MSCRTLRIAVAGINQRTGRRGVHVEGCDISEPRIRSRKRSGPGGRNHRGTSRDPVVAAGADTARNPPHARFQYDLVDRCSTNAEEHVVVHFETFNAVEDLHARARLTLTQNESVVDETVTTVRISGTVSTNAGNTCALRRDVLKHIADDVRVFARRIVADVLVAVRIWSD